MISYKMGENAKIGSEVYANSEDGRLYVYRPVPDTPEARLAANSKPKRKSFREFFKERTGLEPGKWAVPELCDTTMGRLMETVADYMDYISGSEPQEPEPKEPELDRKDGIRTMCQDIIDLCKQINENVESLIYPRKPFPP